MKGNEVLNIIKQINTSRIAVNNNYLFFGELIKKVDDKELTPILFQNTLLLIEDKGEYSKVVFFSKSCNDFLETKDFFYKSNDKLSVNYIVSNNNSNILLLDRFKNVGFLPYKRYKRLYLMKASIDNTLECWPFDYCCKEDSTKIMSELLSTFDIITDNIVSENELEHMIVNEQALSVKINGTIKGFLLFENTGFNSYLRCLCVCRDYRGNGIGRQLVESWINVNKEKTKRFNLWVNCENTPAINLYKNIGFAEDGLEDNIFVLENS